jgi:hypothetical protein
MKGLLPGVNMGSSTCKFDLLHRSWLCGDDEEEEEEDSCLFFFQLWMKHDIFEYY